MFTELCYVNDSYNGILFQQQLIYTHLHYPSYLRNNLDMAIPDYIAIFAIKS